MSEPKTGTPERPTWVAMEMMVGRPSSRSQSVSWSPPQSMGARGAVAPRVEAQPLRAKKTQPSAVSGPPPCTSVITWRLICCHMSG